MAGGIKKEGGGAGGGGREGGAGRAGGGQGRRGEGGERQISRSRHSNLSKFKLKLGSARP